jgi:predicted metalloprotease with PDZ domain
MTFTAGEYDPLVDAPTEMGNFDVTKFEVEGKSHFLVTNQAGAFSKEKADRFTQMLSSIGGRQCDVRRSPYEKYCYFYFFTPP